MIENYYNNSIKLLQMSFTYQTSDTNIKNVSFLHKKTSRITYRGLYFINTVT